MPETTCIVLYPSGYSSAVAAVSLSLCWCFFPLANKPPIHPFNLCFLSLGKGMFWSLLLPIFKGPYGHRRDLTPISVMLQHCWAIWFMLLSIDKLIDDHRSLVGLHAPIDDLLGGFWIVNQFVKASQLEPTIWICIKAFMKMRISLLAALTRILLQRPILSVPLWLPNVVQALPRWSVIVEKHRFFCWASTG